MKASFVFEKETKNTIRFSEICEENENPSIGTIYIQKSALEKLGYSDDNTIEIEVEVNAE